jgi:hypothetical protein
MARAGSADSILANRTAQERARRMEWRSVTRSWHHRQDSRPLLGLASPGPLAVGMPGPHLDTYPRGISHIPASLPLAFPASKVCWHSVASVSLPGSFLLGAYLALPHALIRIPSVYQGGSHIALLSSATPILNQQTPQTPLPNKRRRLTWLSDQPSVPSQRAPRTRSRVPSRATPLVAPGAYRQIRPRTPSWSLVSCPPSSHTLWTSERSCRFPDDSNKAN